ncbi:MAG: hypothetical protein IJR72_05300 [Oscillospiraceae bacterium]|nr:hypothetical protein [Oscillospiraceae bacterium]
MSQVVKEAAQMMELLPEADQRFACEFIRKLVLAWDPDFTKLTPDEAKRLEKAENSGFVDETDVDWENLGVWVKNHTAE